MTSNHEHHWLTASEHATSEGWIGEVSARCPVRDLSPMGSPAKELSVRTNP